MSAPPSKTTTNQPQGATEMKVVGGQSQLGVTQDQQQHQCEHHTTHKAWRMRGGGAAKDCFLGGLACFFCFECCEGCCECIADIICAEQVYILLN